MAFTISVDAGVPDYVTALDPAAGGFPAGVCGASCGAVVQMLTKTPAPVAAIAAPSSDEVAIATLDATTGAVVSAFSVADGVNGIPSGSIESGSQFGLSLTALHVNGTGPIVVVGAPQASHGSVQSTGAVFLVQLSVAVDSVVLLTQLSAGRHGISHATLAASSQFGTWVDALGFREGTAAGTGMLVVRVGTEVNLLRLSVPPSTIVPVATKSANYEAVQTLLDPRGGLALTVPASGTTFSGWFPQVEMRGQALECSSDTACASAPSLFQRGPFDIQRADGLQSVTVTQVEYSMVGDVHANASSVWLSSAAPPAGLAGLSSASAGASMLALGDADNDGCARDFVVGMPGYGSNRAGSGGVALLTQSCAPGAALAAERLTLVHEVDFTPQELPAGAGLGASMAMLQQLDNVNGRKSMLAAGMPGAEAVLLFSVVRRTASWAVNSANRLADGEGGISQGTLSSGALFGSAIATGTFQGDRNVLLVGAPGVSAGSGDILCMLVDVRSGTITDTATTAWLVDRLPTGTLVAGDAFGAALAVVAFDNAALADWQLAVGAPGCDDGNSGSGAVFLLLLPPDKWAMENASAQKVPSEKLMKLTNGLNGFHWNELPSGAHFGSSVAWLGDLDGDGIGMELGVAAPGMAGVAVLSIAPTSAGTALEVARGSWAVGGASGLPAALPSGFGGSMAVAGDWSGDGIYGDVLIGAPASESQGGSVMHVRFAAAGQAVPPPWGSATPTVASVSPSSGLSHDRPTVITITGTALYNWIGTVGTASRFTNPPTVVVGGLQPASCDGVTVTADGSSLTCTLSAAIDLERTLSVQLPAAVTPSVVVSFEPFEAALLSVASGQELDQAGGQSREFTGIGLLPSAMFTQQDLVDNSVKLLVGDKYECPAASLQQSVNGTSITCQSMPAGVGGPHPVRLQLPGGIETNSSVTVTYQAAQLVSTDPVKVIPTISMTTITLYGIGFGHSAGDVPRVVIGGNDCVDIRWVSPTELLCAAVQGNFSNHDIFVYTGVQQLSSTLGANLLRFDDPLQVLAVTPAVVPTAGNVTVTCYIAGLGERVDSVADVLVDSSSCLNWTLVNAFALECIVPAGTGADLFVWIKSNTGIQALSVLPVLSYEPPTVTASAPAAAYADPSDSYTFLLNGTGFGVVDPGPGKLSITVAGQECAQAVHISDTQVECRDVHAPWHSPEVVTVTVGGQSASAAVIEFQDPPKVTNVAPPAIATAGERITLIGSGFGDPKTSTARAFVGDQPCVDVVQTTSGSLSCTAPPGVGRDHAVVVVVNLNGNSSASPVHVSYKPATIGAVTLSTGLASAYAGLSGAGIDLLVQDCGDALSAISVSMTDGTGWEASCSTLERSDGGTGQIESLRCLGVSLAAFPADGGRMVALVAVAGQESTSTSSIPVIGRPQLSAVSVSSAPTAGLGDATSAPVQLLGSNLGLNRSDILSVTVGGVECPRIEWLQPAAGEAASLRIAIPPGVGADLNLVVTTAGGLSSPPSLKVSYQAAEVSVIDPTYALTGTGTASFVILGKHFGDKPSDLDRILIGEQECSDIEWVSPTQVVCNSVSRLQWESESVTVTVGGQEGLKNSYFEHIGDPVIDVVSPDTANIGEQVLILGKAFGSIPADIVKVTVLGEECTDLLHRGSTALSCKLPAPPVNVSAAAVSDTSLLRKVPVVVWNAAGKRSAPGTVSYTGSGAPLTEQPSHVMGWRPVGQSDLIRLRWAYPTDDSMPDADPVESFTIEIEQLEAGADAQVLSVRVSDLQSRGAVTMTSGGMRVFHHSDFIFTALPVVVKVSAVTAALAGPPSAPTAPVPSNCPQDEFLQTHLPPGRWSCAPCPMGAFCGGGTASNVTAQPGSWRVPWSRSGLGFITCPLEAACLGYGAVNTTEREGDAVGIGAGRNQTDAATHAGNGSAAPVAESFKAQQRLLAATAPSSDTPTLSTLLARDRVPTAKARWEIGRPRSMERCEEGYHGTMCTSCQPGYTRWGVSTCRKCKQTAWLGLAMVGILAFVFVIVAFLILSTIKSGAEKNMSVGSAAIKVAFSHIQTVAIAASFNLQWPESVMTLFAGMSTASSVSSEVLSLDCVLEPEVRQQPHHRGGGGDSSPGGGGGGGGGGDGGGGGGEAPEAWNSIFFLKAAVVLAMPLLMLGVAALVWLLVSTCERKRTVEEEVTRGRLRRQGRGGSPVGPSAGHMSNPMHSTTLSMSPASMRALMQLNKAKGPAGSAPPTPVSNPTPVATALASSSATPSSPGPAAGKRKSVVKSLMSTVSISAKHLGVHLSLGDRIFTSAVIILFLVHMSVTTTSLQLLTCRDVVADENAAIEGSDGPVIAAVPGLTVATSGGCDAGHTHRRLVQDLEVCCYDPAAQRRMYGLGIPGLLVYAFGIPITAALLLWWRRAKLDTQHNRTTLGFLYMGFKDDAYYWESVVMLRKVLVAVIAVALEPMGVTLQTYTALALIFALTSVHISVWPYTENLLNRLELGALVTAFVTYESGLFLVDSGSGEMLRIAATLVIFASNLTFLLAASAIIMWDTLGLKNAKCLQGKLPPPSVLLTGPSLSPVGSPHTSPTALMAGRQRRKSDKKRPPSLT